MIKVLFVIKLLYSIFLLFPLGAELIRGVYVTVRVTISLTWRTLERVALGDLMSKYLPLLLQSQSYGERALRALKGDRTAEVALRGESAPEKAGDGGIRRHPSRPVDGADNGKVNWVAAAEVGDLWLSQLHEQSLCSLEPVEGAEVGVVLPDDLSPGAGLPMVLRKSV